MERVFDFKFKNNSIEELERFVTEVLDNIDGKSGTRRKQMYKKANNCPEPKNSYSMLYGYTNIGYISKSKSRKKVEGIPNTYESTYRTEHPELQQIFQQLVDLYCDTKFMVSMVQINKNWKSPPHKDSGNTGVSHIIGLGNYEGGDLVVKYDNIPHMYEIKNSFLSFDGSKYEHYTMPYTGTRYSLVFYKHKLFN